MSRFCGKCDLYDSLVMIQSDDDDEKLAEVLKNLELYVRGADGRDHLVKSDTKKDIAKYYPYLIAIGCHSKDHHVVILSSDSFIDREEEERKEWIAQDVLRYWKKHKTDFNEDDCLDSLSIWSDKERFRSFAHLVALYGNKADFSNIHLPLWEYYRLEWFKELYKLGYTEREAYVWVYKGTFHSPEQIRKRLGRDLKDDKNTNSEN